ncbi:amidase signature enzyme [Rhizodiscina lignyota]|uniref:Amidase signature enzyme n=1 Tax=Rhizodiscina lignyota TaxID=1504668 RepID=A0A9P4M9Y6_9PEZI|nr:amidase signature enzyme [Rhizodiscina lignyota]
MSSQLSIVDASIEDHRQALTSGNITSVELVVKYLIRIATYDIRRGLNAFTVFNPNVLDEAQASDDRRAAGLPPRLLEGIPYTLKDSYKYKGMTVTNGSPALIGLESSEDAPIAARLRAAGAVLIGKTNMPPMAAGGMQRGLYGRAESPYNEKYLTGGFSSGSSNGAATSTTSGMAVFGMGSETVSSGRSPASNNALIAYTPSRGILSCRGLWPLYVTCDVPVPYARNMKDMLDILAVITKPDEESKGDFWREQTHVTLPQPPKIDYQSLAQPQSLRGKRIGVPKMYIGEKDSNPHTKPTVVGNSVRHLFHVAQTDLEALGAEVVYTDFPLVTNYEDETICGETNNVIGLPQGWNQWERGLICAKAWDDFLKQNNDSKIPDLSAVDPLLLFPKPKGYIPDTFIEVKNWIDYAGLPKLAAEYRDSPLLELPGVKQALASLEAQRKRDLEDWMDEQKLDCVVFPAQGDVGLADLEFNLASAEHSLQNGVKYSNGNRAIRHLGVPTVNVPMGVMPEQQMPLNLTFAGKAYEDAKLLEYAYAYEQQSQRRTTPPLTPALATDALSGPPRTSRRSPGRRQELTASVETQRHGDTRLKLHLSGSINVENGASVIVEVYLDGMRVWDAQINNNSYHTALDYIPHDVVRLGWDLEPLPPRPVMVLVVARSEGVVTAAKLLWAE